MRISYCAQLLHSSTVPPAGTQDTRRCPADTTRCTHDRSGSTIPKAAPSTHAQIAKLRTSNSLSLVGSLMGGQGTSRVIGRAVATKET